MQEIKKGIEMCFEDIEYCPTRTGQGYVYLIGDVEINTRVPIHLAHTRTNNRVHFKKPPTLRILIHDIG